MPPRVNFEQAFRRQEQPRIEDYLGRCSPVVRQNLFTELLRSEIEFRQKAGQVPTLAEYLLRFPTWSEAVSAIFAELWDAKVGATLDPIMTQIQRVGRTGSWIVSLEVVAGPHSGRRFEFSRYETFVVARFQRVQVALGTPSTLFICAKDRCAVLRLIAGHRWEETKWPGTNEASIADLNEQLLVIGSKRGLVEIWDATSSPLNRLKIFSVGDNLNCLKLTPDGKSVITADENGSIRMWSVASGKPAGESLLNPSEPLALDVSADGRTLLVGARDTAHVWNLRTATLLRSFVQTPNPVIQVRLTADAKQAILVSDTVSVWNVATAKRLDLFSPLSRVISVDLPTAFSAPVVRLVTETLSGEQLTNSGSENAPVSSRYTCAAISPDGQSAALGSEQRPTVRLVHNDRRPSKELEFAFVGENGKQGNTNPEGAVAVIFSTDGKQVIAAPWSYYSWGTTSWDVATGVQSGPPIAAITPGNNLSRVRLLVPSANNQQFFWGSDFGVRPIDRVTAKTQGGQMFHEDVTSASISSDGRFLATGGRDQLARIWQLSSWLSVGEFAHVSPITSVSLSHDGRVLAVGSADRNCTLWNTETQLPVCEPLHHPAALKHVVLSPSGQSVVTAAEDQRIRVWDVATGFPLGPDLEHSAAILAVGFTPDGNDLVSVTDDGQFHSSRYFQRYRGNANRSRLEIERATGLTSDGRGVISVLTPAAWNDRQVQLGPQR